LQKLAPAPAILDSRKSEYGMEEIQTSSIPPAFARRAGPNSRISAESSTAPDCRRSASFRDALM
jgi:hypothetical protein